VECPDDQDTYVRRFYESEGIELEKDAIRPNAAKRALVKLCLNSMWRKLTERNNGTKTKIITDLSELYIFLATPGVEVVNLLFATDDAIFVSRRYSAEERVLGLRNTNEFRGAYVTAGARIHLYSFLDKLQQRAFSVTPIPFCLFRTNARPD
jgi:hypothetical protein